VPAYAGVPVELGNAGQRGADLSSRSARKDGSEFLGLDTPPGPVYVGVRYDQFGSTPYDLSLGRTF
jgi:NTE family protein